MGSWLEDIFKVNTLTFI